MHIDDKATHDRNRAYYAACYSTRRYRSAAVKTRGRGAVDWHCGRGDARFVAALMAAWVAFAMLLFAAVQAA